MNARPKGRRASSPSRLRQLAPWITVAALVLAVGAAVLWLSPPAQSPEEADIVVYKRPTCGCCSKWLEHLRRHDLSVAVVNVRSTQPMQSRVGVPRELGSCHTATVGDYWVEGHVPADLIKRLMSEQPTKIRGLSVPGMPIGSPGMEGPNPVEYDVLAYDQDGQTHVYATRQGQQKP